MLWTSAPESRRSALSHLGPSPRKLPFPGTPQPHPSELFASYRHPLAIPMVSVCLRVYDIRQMGNNSMFALR
ncbi:hypothetical protein HMPREF9599_00136 [Cutibacterium acnes HL050PA2]|nr:hypothetical protein HMPREF9599_00136 [Cutibacterium acnes HL050PA2]